MLKRYTFWLTAAIVFLALNTVLHTASLFISPSATDDTERQLIDLLTTYKFDLGLGFHPTFGGAIHTDSRITDGNDRGKA